MASAPRGWFAGCPTSLPASARLGASIVCLSGICALAGLVSPGTALGQTLRGSRSSVQAQYDVALDHDFTFIRSSRQLQSFVREGYLVPVKGGRYYELAGVSYPYARPAVLTFVERLSEQFFAASGEKLVVTSLTRPLNRQPRNASDKSVHPTGMALDLRIPSTRSGRRWLESTLLSLENGGVIEATKERYPAHYHVAVFCDAYEAYVERVTNAARDRDLTHKVAEGDTLWSIARQYNTTVGDLLSVNGLKGSETIYPGQNLTIPITD